MLDALRSRWPVITVDTGQHYDFELNGLLYQQLGVSRPDHFLEIGSDTPASQTAAVLAQRPRSSTANIQQRRSSSATLRARSGARSPRTRKAYPSCTWRRGCDPPSRICRGSESPRGGRLAHLLCAPSSRPRADSGRRAPPARCHDRRCRAAMYSRGISASRRRRRKRRRLLATAHRAALTADPEALAAVSRALGGLGLPGLLPLHPRTRLALERSGCSSTACIDRVRPPMGYLETIAAVRRRGRGRHRLWWDPAGGLLVGNSVRDAAGRDGMGGDRSCRGQRPPSRAVGAGQARGPGGGAARPASAGPVDGLTRTARAMRRTAVRDAGRDAAGDPGESAGAKADIHATETGDDLAGAAPA